jgi:hypothetical protein
MLNKLSAENNKKSSDYHRIPILSRVGYSLGSAAATQGILLPFILASETAPPLAFFPRESEKAIKNYKGFRKKLKLFFRPSKAIDEMLSSAYENASVKGGLRHAGVIGAGLLPVVTSPDSKLSKYSPLIGAVASLPISVRLVKHYGKKEVPLALIYTGTATAVPALTRAIKKHLYNLRMKAERHHK